MASSLVYIFSRALYRISTFFRNWYVGGARFIAHRTLGALESLDRTLALRVTLSHFFEPLYQDYSVIGRTMGILFRSFRVLVSVVIYAVIICVAVVAYVLWASALAYAFYRAMVYFF